LKNVPAVILMIVLAEPIDPVDVSVIGPVDVVESLHVIVAVPPLAIFVPAGGGVARPLHVACLGGLPVARVLRPDTDTLPLVMAVPGPEHPVTDVEDEMVC
jgi:hypothetical protein